MRFRLIIAALLFLVATGCSGLKTAQNAVTPAGDIVQLNIVTVPVAL